jgi:ribonuclease BN (tRNA processing enzyme)
MGRSLEETQERTRQNEGKIADVDQRAQAAAKQANDAASAAHSAANEAGSRASAADAKAVEQTHEQERL